MLDALQHRPHLSRCVRIRDGAQVKDKRKRQQERTAETPRAGVDLETMTVAERSVPSVSVQFLNYPEIHPNIDLVRDDAPHLGMEQKTGTHTRPSRPHENAFVSLWSMPQLCTRQLLQHPHRTAMPLQADLRPFWVWRGGEWLWRVAGGGLQTLSYRTADGKVSKEGLAKPTKKIVVPNSVQIALQLENGQWQVSQV